jgi:xylan 1,4-beta-xylosidase
MPDDLSYNVGNRKSGGCSMAQAVNPILPGFNPDPSIVRVGEDYYIATSTFEWFPGVQIHHSTDLVNWKLLTRPLTRRSQLDMYGIPDSGGIWAPCLSRCDGLFYLIVTNVRSTGFPHIDTPNYLFTAENIAGPWSEPVFLNGSGFDPSLFHDDDGRKWLVNMQQGNGNMENPFNGILLQEYDSVKRKLTGPVTNIFRGTSLKMTEGPHLYRINGRYYLITSEGGTEYEHAVTVARSDNLEGPYEVHPDNPLITSADDRNLPLQKAGHGDMVETPDGRWYLVHLCGRPVAGRGLCILGRETAIQEIVWGGDGWPRLARGGHTPVLRTDVPGTASEPVPRVVRYDFDGPELPLDFQTLRVPLGEDVLTLTERPGFLRLKGKETLSSRFTQALTARRQQAFCFTAETIMEFSPETVQQTAGLISFYNTYNYHYLNVSFSETLGRVLNIISCGNFIFDRPLGNEPVSLPEEGPVYLRVSVNHDRLQFFHSLDGKDWEMTGPVLDAGILSDDHVLGMAFTGAFTGICCQDPAGEGIHADFDYFSYREE